MAHTKKGLSLSEAYIFNKTRAALFSVIISFTFSAAGRFFYPRAPLSRNNFQGCFTACEFWVCKNRGHRTKPACSRQRNALCAKSWRWLGQRRHMIAPLGVPAARRLFSTLLCAPPPSQWNLSAASGTSRCRAALGVSKVRFSCLLKCTTLTLNPGVYLWRVCVHGVVLKLEATRVTWCQLSHSSFILIPVCRAPRMKHELCESYFLSRRPRFCEIFCGRLSSQCALWCANIRLKMKLLKLCTRITVFCGTRFFQFIFYNWELKKNNTGVYFPIFMEF